MTHNTASPHELIASDEYWEHPLTNLHSRTLMSDGTLPTAPRLYVDKKTIGEIAERVLDMSGGVRSQPINQGESIPIPPKESRQVVKIVHDWRRVVTVGIRRPRQARLEAFDESATEMVEDTLYSGSMARTIAPYRRPFSTAHLQRVVLYARGDASGTGLVGITSVNFLDIDSDDRYIGLGLFKVPKVRVGERYYHNMLNDWVGKIAMAEVLEPHGSLRSNLPRRRKASTKKTEEQSLFPNAKPQLIQ